MTTSAHAALPLPINDSAAVAVPGHVQHKAKPKHRAAAAPILPLQQQQQQQLLHSQAKGSGKGLPVYPVAVAAAPVAAPPGTGLAVNPHAYYASAAHPSPIAMKALTSAPTLLIEQHEAPKVTRETEDGSGWFSIPGFLSPMAVPQPPLIQVPQLVPVKGSPVVLHVYHLGGKKRIRFANRLLRLFGSGAYHAAVEVYGLEWSYGAKRIGTGVFPCPPMLCTAHTYKNAYLIGYTPLSQSEVEQLIAEMSLEWQGIQYDLLRRNCTHFSKELCQRLGAGETPTWVTSLAAAGARLEEVRDLGEHSRMEKGSSPGTPISDFVQGLAELGKSQRGAEVDDRTHCLDFARGCRRCCDC